MPKGYAFKIVLIPVFFCIISSFPLAVMAKNHDPQAWNRCDVHHASCKTSLSGIDIIFDITPKPVRAMKFLTFRLEVLGKKLPTRPHIDLGMPGMVMGPNRVVLREVSDGIYEGEGIIVRCPSGKRTWRADITLPGVGTLGFVFDVIY